MVVSTHLKNISQRIVSLGRGEHLKSWNHHLAVYSWSIPNLPTSLRIESCSFHGLLLPLANSLSILSSTWTFLCHARHKGFLTLHLASVFFPTHVPFYQQAHDEQCEELFLHPRIHEHRKQLWSVVPLYWLVNIGIPILGVLLYCHYH